MLKERFSRYDRRNTGIIGFDDFSAMMGEVLFDAGVFREQVRMYNVWVNLG